ncbi:MAG: hypothetical protein PHH54_01450 [Candidatus Nanoarchaeia archaeon]|nr:hypothetical protein [Candidatus Nanoarchaeia archaeon]MDD5740629.1 hypothetical protein [Candidatus Nanoarchaeia archaeon]
MNKKGQAAMEFLMTYGWAILAAVIAIGVLAYFGVFSPGKYISNSCVINNPLGCDEYGLRVGAIDLVIRNGGGESITISDINVTGCTNTGAIPAIADGGKTSTITVTCGATGDMISGAKVKKDIVITYTKTSGTIAQTTTGTITGRVP